MRASLSSGTRVLDQQKIHREVSEILVHKYTRYTVLGSGDSPVDKTKSVPSWSLKPRWGRQQTNRQMSTYRMCDEDDEGYTFDSG